MYGPDDSFPLSHLPSDVTQRDVDDAALGEPVLTSLERQALLADLEEDDELDAERFESIA